MNNIFLQLALVLILSSVFGYLAHRFKLPLVIAYLLSGLLFSLVLFIDPAHVQIFEFLPELGIALVLFLIGMELDLREIKSLGKPIVVGALVQIIISTLAGMTITKALGFSAIDSFYLGLGLSFSSTVVVIKLLLEKRDLASLYGKLSIGILLIEDLIAIGVLMGISVGSSTLQLGFQESLPLLALVAKALGLFILTYVLSRYVLERLFTAVATSIELLFLTALAWCFLFTTLAIISGFSVVIGAFLAGVALASSAYRFQIQSKIKPLRDFFVTLFFVYLGAQVKVGDFITHWPTILSLTAYALIVKPVIFLSVLGLFGFRRHTLFQTSLNLSQISEFSLVILLIGSKLGIVPPTLLSIMAAVTVLSVIISSVLISYSKKLYKVFSKYLGFFEHKTLTHYFEVKHEDQLLDHVVVVGAYRVGGPLVRFLKREKIPFIVMDFNPHVVEELKDNGVNVVYGDIGDPEVLASLQLETAKLIISTATDFGDNEMLLVECQRRKVQAKIVARAFDPEHGEILKKLGADYVIIPEKVSGDFIVNQLKHHWPQIHFAYA